EEPEGRRRHAAEPAVAADGAAVLPERLQRAEGPPEALLVQRPERVRHLGIADGRGLVVDPPPDAADAPGEVHGFGHGVAAVAARLQDCLATPRADRTRNDAHRVDGRVGAAIEVLAGDVLDGL